MIKIKSIKFDNHAILGNLELDFCDKDGNPADTIIIAGENGTGKTTILEEIYKVMNYQTDCKNLLFSVVCNDESFVINYGDKMNAAGNAIANLTYKGQVPNYQYGPDFQNDTRFSSLYLTANINFAPNKKVKAISSNNTDLNHKKNNKFTENTAENIKQLLVDIKNFDNKIIVDRIEEYIGEKITDKILKGKIDIFKDAFDTMFENLKFKNIDNKNSNIEILFEKNSKEISIDDLSSGEKQIVFRGVFLLRDKNALNGAVVLIDEPEISMHPKWQEKILDYYRNLFIDEGKPTSQMIASTHSNFVIENALKLDNSVIIALQENNQVKKIIKDDGTFILPSVTSAEVNYHVFDIANIDYHIQLFGYFQSITSIDKIENIDNKIKNNKSLLSKNVFQDSQGNACKWIYNNTIYETICCFIRNAIDHPDNLPKQTKKEYTKDDLKYSIEILIELIKLAEQNQLS